MNIEAVLDVPVRVVRTSAATQASAELYPSALRSLLLRWQASRLGDYLDDPARTRVVGRETGARV